MNRYKSTTEFSGLSGQVVFNDREDNYVSVKIAPSKRRNFYTFNNFFRLYREVQLYDFYLGRQNIFAFKSCWAILLLGLEIN